jgi:dolichol-phosphate mannosyltransferase
MAEKGSDATAPRGLVVIPTYNEREAIRELIGAILSQPLPLEVLVVDDHSPDGTADLVREMAARDGRIRLMERAGKMGLGSAYVAAFRYALAETGAELIFQMDADFSHDPAALGSFVAAMRYADLVLGSRYLCGVTVVNWPLKRLFLSYGANRFTRALTRLPVKDATGGFKCFRREVLAALDWGRIHSDGYSFQIETTFHAWRQGWRIREIPILFVDRRVGISKMSRRIVWEAMVIVWRLALTGWLRPRPRPRALRGGRA